MDYGSIPYVRYGELFERRALREPHRTAIRFGGDELSYAQLLARVEAAATQLTALGVQRGQRVVCIASNRPEILIALYATARLGAIFTPLSGNAPAGEIRHVIDDLSPAVVLADATAVPAVEEAVRATGLELIALDAGPSDRWARLQTEVSATAPPSAVVGAQDTALIVYTSGTTGRPKGVALTHGALFWNNYNTLLSLDVVGDDVMLVNAPLFHIGSLNGLSTVILQKGGALVIQDKFAPDTTLKAIQDERITVMFAVPTMLSLMQRDPSWAETDLSSLSWIVGGGAPFAPAQISAWAERGPAVLASYGLSEAGPSVTYRRTSAVSGKAESAGKPALLTDLEVVDPDGNALAPGQVGSLVVRAPHLAREYWGNPEATSAAFRDGALHTGDRGYFDDDGDLMITGRAKEVIITGGENVDPVEVEQALLGHPEILEAVVIGLPDPLWGEIVAVAIVSTENASLDPQQVQAFLSPLIARYKIPRRLFFRESIPKSAVGKISRPEVLRGAISEDAIRKAASAESRTANEPLTARLTIGSE